MRRRPQNENLHLIFCTFISHFLFRDLGLDLFVNLVIPDKPTYYPIVLPDEEIKDISNNSKIDLESFIQAS